MITLSIQWFHAAATILIFLIMVFWGFKTHGDFDFSPIVKIPILIIVYMTYWIIYLILTRG